jgi:glycosyltransferase involved in cell wall biosynthesis
LAQHGVGVDGRERTRVLILGMGWFTDEAGGLNRYVADLHRALAADSGLAVSQVTLGPGNPAPGVTFAADRTDALPMRLWRFARAAGAAGRRADVIDAHFALYSFLPVRGPLRHRPLVAHVHGPWGKESEMAGEGRRAVALKTAVERAVYRRATELVVLSGAFRRLLVERYRVSPWRIHVIPPGVDLTRFSPEDRQSARVRLRVERDAWIAVSVRRLVPRMGLDILLEAWATMCRESGPGAVLVIVGEGPARRDLEAMVSSLDLSDNVRFTGRVDDEDLVAWYQAADLCVVPTIALEGFGLIVLEALACGTPVVASDAGGLPETLTGLNSSLIVPAADPGALASRMTRARSDPASLPDRIACRRFAEQFTWDRAATRHREVYQRVAAGPARPGARPSRRLRVVFVDHTAKLSGAEIALLRLIPALEDVDAHVVLGEEGPLVGRLLGAGVSVEVLPLGRPAAELRRERVRPGRLPAASVLATATHIVALARRLRRLEPDLVHTNSLKAALYGGAAARLAGIPVVWHVHDRIAADYLPAGAVRLVRLAAARIPAAIIANSAATLASLGDAPRLAAVIPSPVDSSLIRVPSSRQTRPGEPLLFGIVGRLTPWKGQHVFLDAFARAFGTTPDSHRAAVIGAALFGEESYEAELRVQATALGIAARVEFRGFQDDIGFELGRLDVLVHASIVPEPFGNVIVEGMAAGLPVVASAAGGPLELVAPGLDGLLVAPGDVDGLARALRLLADDADLRARLGGAGAQKAHAFTADRVAADVVGLYRSVVEPD